MSFGQNLAGPLTQLVCLDSLCLIQIYTVYLGLIRERDWNGPNGMCHVRTKKEPKQPIPTFAETVELLMRVSQFSHRSEELTFYTYPSSLPFYQLIHQPEYLHASFNIDIKPNNDPAALFTLLHKIVSSYENWEQNLAPRILLGLWHPKFLEKAKEVMPYACRSYIGRSLEKARKFFWEDCHVFSVNFTSLVGADGQK